MVYWLEKGSINDWLNTKIVFIRSLAAGEWFMNSSSVLPTVPSGLGAFLVWKLVVYCFYSGIIPTTRDRFHGLTGTIKHS